ncbi:YlxR family protein [Caproiciproducens sp. NJN-50]|uniref:RNase P modulator RnpM n=1 Tax=Acutalibacteraceae TaxID=3082771 RepID=UPI000FFDFB80|nr:MULTISPECIES: YlxR family protein [Acutalibacteraceae]QAT51140.1 YlxR family protein [Caproiciproducens sp. NJN-50]
MQKRKVPLRMCAGCGQMKPKKELVRVVKSPEGEISLDLTGRKPGRGAYVCRSADCLKAARKARRLEKAFSCRIPDEVYDRLEEELNGNES